MQRAINAEQQKFSDKGGFEGPKNFLKAVPGSWGKLDLHAGAR